jgi:hypothetical protein
MVIELNKGICEIDQIIDSEMPARRGWDQILSNLSAVAEPWVKLMGKIKVNH